MDLGYFQSWARNVTEHTQQSASGPRCGLGINIYCGAVLGGGLGRNPTGAL